MADADYAVIFQGRIADGADAAAVRANMAKLFKADEARIEKMFSGQKVVIKKGLDAETASKYKAALGKAGALVEIVDLVAMAAAKAAASASAAAQQETSAPLPAAAAEPAVQTSASPESAAASAPPPADPPQIVPAAFADGQTPEALETSMADPGEILVEYQRVEAPDIATDHLTVADVVETLAEHTPPPEPEYDLSSLTLDEPGVTLVEPEAIATPEFDTSAMSLAENT